MRRPDEQAAINAVFKVLRDEGFDPLEDSSIDDNPDCVFELSGKRVAADCTNINLEQLMKWSNSTKRLEHGKQYEIKFAVEPHFWIKQSINEKEPKITQYLENGRAESAWLIAHALENPTNFDCTDSFIKIMQDAVRFLCPEFEQIWFIHSKYPATRIWRKGDPQIAQFPKWDTTNQEYPFESIIQSIDTISQGGFNKTVVFGGSSGMIELQPLDPDYRNENNTS